MKTSLYSMFKTDTSLETEGVELKYGETENGDDIVIVIARAGGSNKQYQKALTTKLRPYRRQAETGTLAKEVADDIMLDVFAETVVKSWRNITDADGNVLQFNAENVKKVFRDLPDLYADVQSAAMSASVFKAEAAEDAAKN